MNISILPVTLAQRMTELRRMARLVSADALCDLRRLAPYMTSAGSVFGIAVAVATSKLLMTSGDATDGLGWRPAPERTGSARAAWWTSLWSSRHTTTRRSIGIVLVCVALTVVGSQIAERAINRLLRPDAAEWTWIGDVILSTGLVVMTVFWAQLKQARGTISSLETQRIVLDVQLSVAANVQRAMLPPIPEPLNGVRWYGSVEPAGLVGGDYFDFLALPSGKMLVIVADISGKGIAAALFMSNVRAIVHALVREISAPNELLVRLSHAMRPDAQAGLYATCFVALVDTKNRTLTYSNAGHPPGILTGSRGVFPLRAGGPPVGLFDDVEYESETLSFGEGEMITIVSDGVSEALDVSADLLPSALAAEIARGTCNTPQEACTQLLDATRGSTGPRDVMDWSDDRTVVAFG
jgi:hypothetical protein